MGTKSFPSFYYTREVRIVNVSKKNKQQTHDSKAQLNKSRLLAGHAG